MFDFLLTPMEREEKVHAICKRFETMIDNIQMRMIAASWPNGDEDTKDKIIRHLQIRLDRLIKLYNQFLFDNNANHA